MKLTDLTPDSQNARAHDERNVDMIVSSLEEVGAARSIVIDEDGTILAGNATVEAALKAGLKNVKVVETNGSTVVAVRRTGLTPEEKKRLALLDNRTAELATWDVEVLADIWRDNKTLLSGVFEQDELADILGDLLQPEPEPDPGAQVDKAAELQEKWGTALDQVWEVGEHRIMCGDCTEGVVVGAVMRGEKAGAAVTDPPFNVGFDYKTGFNDKKSLDDYGGWLWHALELWESQLAEPWCFFVWQAVLTCRCWPEWFPRDYRLFASVKGWAQYRPTPVQFSWDPVLFWSRGTSEVKPQAGRRDYFVSAPSHQQEHGGGSEHPCPRPLDACHYIVGELCEPGIVIDPFLGSGTTAVACQQLGRKCRGVEIEPKYIAVTLERLSGMGLNPILTNG